MFLPLDLVPSSFFENMTAKRCMFADGGEMRW